MAYGWDLGCAMWPAARCHGAIWPGAHAKVMQVAIVEQIMSPALQPYTALTPHVKGSGASQIQSKAA